MAAKKQSARTLDDFKSVHDPAVVIPNRIRDALQAMAEDLGPEAWEYEAELLERTRLSTTQLARHRHVFAADHVVEVGAGKQVKRVWFADPKVAAVARGRS